MSKIRPRASRSHVRYVAFVFAGLLLAIGGAGCAGTSSTKPSAIEPPRTVSADTILCKPRLDPELELEALSRSRAAPALLRRAYLELYCERPQAAIDAAAEVLYGPTKPSANEEAFARYLRAQAHAKLGMSERGQRDLERARELALDSELQRLLGTHVRGVDSDPSLGNAAEAVAINDRSAWSPQAPDRGNLEPMGAPMRLTIHHSAMYFRDTRPAACAAQIQRIQREHMGNRGYGDIGYHFLIDPAGRIWEGRELRWQGAHASGENNRRNIGICVLGNFLRGRGGQGPTTAQVEAMRQLIVKMMRQYKFGPDAIYNHSDFKATECPGPLMEAAVARLVGDLRYRTDGNRLAAAEDD